MEMRQSKIHKILVRVLKAYSGCRVIAGNINIRTAVNHNKFLLVSSIYATRFSRADYLQNAHTHTHTHTYMYKICDISLIVHVITVCM